MPAIGALDHPVDVAAYQVFERDLYASTCPGDAAHQPGAVAGRAIIAQALTDLADIEQPTALDLLTALRDATDHNKSLAPVSGARNHAREA